MTTKTKSKSTSKKATVRRSTALARRSERRILITGGTGFLGAHILRELIESGATNLRVMATSIPSWLSALGVETSAGSITSTEDVKRAVEDVSAIYHLAGKVSRRDEDARTMYAVHVDGTRTLCDVASSAGVESIVMASTSGTIGVTKERDSVSDERTLPPVDIFSRWPYYASKFYQEQAAQELFNGKNRRLVIMNPSLLLGPGDDRLSSTKVVLDFMGRKIMSIPSGGLSFVDVRDTAKAFIAAMEHGKDKERYLLGSANWTFKRFFDRLERISKVQGPRVALPSKVAVAGSKLVSDLWKQWNWTPPVEPGAVEMAEHFWYISSEKAMRELEFTPREPSETLLDTVAYVREHFLGGSAFGKSRT